MVPAAVTRHGLTHHHNTLSAAPASAVRTRLGGTVKEITLSNGMVAVVDDEDYPLVSRIRWHAVRRRHTYYAIGHVATIGLHGRMKMHRVVLGSGCPAFVDHANRNGLDNRRCNLRNQARRKNAAHFKGVSKGHRSNSWCASTTLKNQRLHLGSFKTAEEAAHAYNCAALNLFGEFAHLNEIPTATV